MTNRSAPQEMRLLRGKSIGIVGAGPAGLTLARLLQMRGASVKVFELDPSVEARNQGGALDLHPATGQRALEVAGLIEEFNRLSRPEGQETKVLDKHGKVFVDLKPQDESIRRPEIDRGELRSMLFLSVKPDTVKWSHRLIAVDRSSAGRPRLRFAEHGTEEVDLLFGCDGAWSRVRPLVCDTPPRYSGITFIEGRISNAQEKCPEVSELVGQGAIMITSDNRAIICQRNADGHIRIYACIREPEKWLDEQGFNFNDPKQVRTKIMVHYMGWAPHALAIFANSDDYFVRRPIYTHEPTQNWNPQPDISLAGDAAHVMPPYTGKGVNLAMLDSLELANTLTDGSHASVDAALRAYERVMLDRMHKEIATVLEDQDVFISASAPEGIVELFKKRLSNPS
jgi:2-polyprenyl-6-methoxyphenol hydroxylase-like FAD-dependent oxidoreductase